MATDAPGRTGIMSTMTVIKWAYRHGNLEADTFDTLEDAASAAQNAADYGHEALHCIEVINPDGSRTVHDADAVWEMTEPIRQAEAEEFESRPPLVARVRIQGPGGRWGTDSSYSDPEAAEVAADEWRRLIGPERVKVEPF